MPSEMPTYYSWAQERPCTTNETYGYSLRQSTEKENAKKSKQQRNATKNGYNQTTSPNRNCNDDDDNNEETAGRKRNRWGQGKQNKPINVGYVTGFVPVTQKVQGGRKVGTNLVKVSTVPDAFEFSESSNKDVYLWHALSGNLVHCKTSKGSEL